MNEKERNERMSVRSDSIVNLLLDDDDAVPTLVRALGYFIGFEAIEGREGESLESRLDEGLQIVFMMGLFRHITHA